MGQLFHKNNKHGLAEGMTEAHDLQNIFPGWKKIVQDLGSFTNYPNSKFKTSQLNEGG